jgi:hypothetical protein
MDVLDKEEKEKCTLTCGQMCRFIFLALNVFASTTEYTFSFWRYSGGTEYVSSHDVG